MALLCAALGVGTTTFAGGADCHDNKAEATSAQASKHECNMTAEECAQEMQKNMATRGWLGINMDQSDEAMTINKVYPGSPAEQAGFHTGDKIVSINGVQVSDKNEEKLHGMLKNAKIGEQVTYVVERGSEDVTLKAKLVQIPQDVLAQIIDQHMKADHTVAKN